MFGNECKAVRPVSCKTAATRVRKRKVFTPCSPFVTYTQGNNALETLAVKRTRSVANDLAECVETARQNAKTPSKRASAQVLISSACL
jgi:hypothetical protein